MSKNPFGSGSAKLKVVRSSPLAGARGKILIEKRWKQSKDII